MGTGNGFPSVKKISEYGLRCTQPSYSGCLKTVIEHDSSKDADDYYRSRMPLAEYNNLIILAYPDNEKTEAADNKRDMMWFIWDKHNPDGYTHLDKENYKKMSLYTAWYRRIYGKNIPAKKLNDLIVKGEYKDSYTVQDDMTLSGSEIITEHITPEKLEEKAVPLLRQKALEAYFHSLTGRDSFDDGEVYIYQSMLFHAVEEFAKHGFLLSDADVKEIMEAVFLKNPISDKWAKTYNTFSMSPVKAEHINFMASTWDKITGGEKERLESILKKMIDEKVAMRTEEREKHWKEAKNSREDGLPVASGLLYSEAGIVFNHALLTESDEIYSDDFLDINGENFTITWKTVLPGDTDYKTGTYLCIAEIAGYPGTRIEFSLPLDDLKNDILKQMIELAETAEGKGDTSWSTCQGATSGMFLFEEKKEDFTALLEDLTKLNHDYNTIQQQAVQAPGLLARNSTEVKRISDLIQKNLADIETLQKRICEYAGSTDPGEKKKQINLMKKLKTLMETIRKNFSKIESIYEQSKNALTAYSKFENMIQEYESLVGESGWARQLSDGFAAGLIELRNAENFKAELMELKTKADALMTKAKNVYSDPESESTLEEVRLAYLRVERPLNELKDCLDMAKNRKERNLPLWESVNPELAKAELNYKNACKKWEKLISKKENIGALAKEISEFWQSAKSQFLEAENSESKAETCAGRTGTDGEAIVPNFSGMSMTTAKKTAQRAGFNPVFKGGNSAPSKELAYTVSDQNPAPGEALSKGLSVNIILYGKFAGYKIPDVTGLSSKNAKETLKNAGFGVALSGGDPAPNKKLKYKVQSQEPVAGEKAEQGTIVKIRVYGDVHYVSVPSLVKMTSGEAKAAVKSAGLVPDLSGGNSAPKKALSYHVQSQSPSPNSKVMFGSMVSITVYGQFNEAAALSDKNCENLDGSILKWDYENDRAVCQCPSGMIINKSHNACIENPNIKKQQDRKNQFWSSVVKVALPIIVEEITGGNSGSGSRSVNNTSGNNSSGGISNGSSSGSLGSGPSESSGLSYEECERKHCPECSTKADIDLLRESTSPQCMDCRKKKKNIIKKCMSGKNTGSGTTIVKKEYKVVGYKNDEGEWIDFDCVKVSYGGGIMVYGPDTWENCYYKTNEYKSTLPKYHY